MSTTSRRFSPGWLNEVPDDARMAKVQTWVEQAIAYGPPDGSFQVGSFASDLYVGSSCRGESAGDIPRDLAGSVHDRQGLSLTLSPARIGRRPRRRLGAGRTRRRGRCRVRPRRRRTNRTRSRSPVAASRFGRHASRGPVCVRRGSPRRAGGRSPCPTPHPIYRRYGTTVTDLSGIGYLRTRRSKGTPSCARRADGGARQQAAVEQLLRGRPELAVDGHRATPEVSWPASR
jgi:hypothetical protein